jgi:hypothetical protein
MYARGRGEEEMATDYDAPRRSETDEVSEDSLEELKARRNEAQSAVVDVDESDTAESFELPGADLSGELLPGASPQPTRDRRERRHDLHGLRGLTPVPSDTHEAGLRLR